MKALTFVELMSKVNQSQLLLGKLGRNELIVQLEGRDYENSKIRENDARGHHVNYIGDGFSICGDGAGQR